MTPKGNLLRHLVRRVWKHPLEFHQSEEQAVGGWGIVVVVQKQGYWEL